MSYRTAFDLASALSDGEKLKLAQNLLGQLALSLENTATKTSNDPMSADYEYCLERVLKSKPNRLPKLRAFMEAIFSFKGSQNANIDDLIKRLESNRVIRLDGENVTYLVD